MHEENKTRMTYFVQDDVLHLAISDEPEARSIELIPNVTVELNDKGELIGIEILNASAFAGYHSGVGTSQDAKIVRSADRLNTVNPVQTRAPPSLR